MQLLVYSESSSQRSHYIFTTLLRAIGIADFELTTDKSSFKNADAAKINYSIAPEAKNEIWIVPVELLFETGIVSQQIVCFNYNDTTAFFKTSAGDLPFDIFAASFYLLSRYEEYLPHKKDSYGRYAHDNSLAYKENFLQLPIVNLWLQILTQLVKRKFPFVTVHRRVFTFIPTYDIDIAYSYLHKGVIRNLGGFLKAAWHSNWVLVKERMQVLFNNQRDPFDSYQLLDELHRHFKLTPIYFFLLARKNTGYDKNIPPGKNAMKLLIRLHNEQYALGIHPSWQSGDVKGCLKEEKRMLEKLAGKSISRSRQHYIRMTLPETYRVLIESGIKEDYSMGYGSINGFRASYCLSFNWYDLSREEMTDLTVFPFCYMDANSLFEQHFTSEEALAEMLYYFDIVKKVDGLFISIWHNHILGTDRLFTGWREAYRTAIDRIKKDIEP